MRCSFCNTSHSQSDEGQNDEHIPNPDEAYTYHPENATATAAADIQQSPPYSQIQSTQSFDINVFQASTSTSDGIKQSGLPTTTSSVKILNAQPNKYPSVKPPHTQSSEAETEETYVDYRVSHIQGGGNNPNMPSATPKPSEEGAYSLVAHSMKLSTV